MSLGNGIILAKRIESVIIVEMRSPVAIREDGTFSPATLRDAVEDRAYRFEIHVRYDGRCDLHLLRYYATTREAAEAAAEKIRSGDI